MGNDKMKTIYDLSNVKSKLKNNGDAIDLPHDDHLIQLLFIKDYNGKMKYFLDFNGSFVKSGSTLKPIITKLNQLGIHTS